MCDIQTEMRKQFLKNIDYGLMRAILECEKE